MASASAVLSPLTGEQASSPSTSSAPTTTREAWLLEVARELLPHFEKAGYPVLKPIRISVGWASKGGARGKAIGECWTHEASADGVHEIFVTPRIADAEVQAATLLHEMCHVVAGIKAKHGKAFKRIAVALGLEGKMSATHAGDVALAIIRPIIAKVGPFPHAQLDPSAIITSGPKKQSTRLLKAECEGCGYVVRGARKWLVDVGAPICPACRVRMTVEGAEDGEGGEGEGAEDD